ncbi:type II toxin-antitoxin system PemK/MazF family toxin [uncultured Sphingomonas sp.]|uniref:type II toxin-antitoxin system PemK/MazF family toxin n=1 Tax=uncultured Sphingomonas sp. TaxID=158754 RepID=UPI0035C99482
MKRGDIWLCMLDPTVGSEIRKTRPCLIVSPDLLNGRLHTVIVAPLTSGGRPSRFRVAVTFQNVLGLILPDQLRTLDKARLVKRLGRVDAEVLDGTLAVLGEMFRD